MPFTDAELRAIIARAATPQERLTEAYSPLDHQDDALLPARLERWIAFAANHDLARFERRLSLDGLDKDTAQRMIRDVRFKDDQPLPEWAILLNEALAEMPSLEALLDPEFTETNRFLIPDDPKPFEEILVPFLYAGRKRMRAALPAEALARFSAVALAQMESGLIDMLSSACGQTLLLEFSLYRAPHITRLVGFAPGEHPRDLYDAFVREFHGGRLARYLTEYAALARLVGTLTLQWVTATTECIRRIHEDWDAIHALFGRTLPSPNEVLAVKGSASDRHREGRTVNILRFDNGLRVVYKPKSLGLDAAYDALLVWLNDRAKADPFIHAEYPPLKAITTLAREDYGYAEFVEFAPIRDEDAARRYYRRAGALMAILYAIGGTDFHRENVIAAGEYPTLIDMELSLYPHVRPFEGIEDEITLHAADWVFGDSVLGSGLLTAWGMIPGGKSVDIAGLGGDTAEELAYRAPKWFNPNRDTITYQPGTHHEAHRENVLFLLPQGETVAQYAPPYRYRDEIESGLRAAYALIVRNRSPLTAPDGPLAQMAEHPARYLLRATRLYSLIYQRSTRPDCTRDGTDRAFIIEQLARGMILQYSVHPFWRALAEESASVMRGDIPLFPFHPAANALLLSDDSPIMSPFAESGFDLAIRRILAMSGEDLERQVGLMRGALALRFAAKITPTITAAEGSKPFAVEPDSLAPLKAETLVERALEIADALRESAIPIGRGVEWVQPQFDVNTGRFDLGLMSYTLYEGKAGVGIFLAAVAKLTGDPTWRDMTVAAVRNLRVDVHHPESTVMRRFGIGGMDGFASAVYGLTKMAILLDDSTFLADAAAAARGITPQRIAADRRLDILGGAAGAILGLLALQRTAPNDEWIATAKACGDHLLANRTAGEDGLRAWVTLEGTRLIGFLHGSAGIGMALIKLYEVTGEAKYLEAALEAIAYERTKFNAEAKNFPDLRPSQQPPDGRPFFIDNYCHGSAGIALARLVSLTVVDDPEAALLEIDACLTAASQPALAERFDFLCCGTFGRIESLLVNGVKLHQPDWVDTAGRRAAYVLARRKARGYFYLDDALPPGMPLYSLFQGVTGIGYGLLRLAFPNLLPSVAILD